MGAHLSSETVVCAKKLLICEDSVLLWCEMVTTDVRVWSLLREHDDMPQHVYRTEHRVWPIMIISYRKSTASPTPTTKNSAGVA